MSWESVLKGEKVLVLVEQMRGLEAEVVGVFKDKKALTDYLFTRFGMSVERMQMEENRVMSDDEILERLYEKWDYFVDEAEMNPEGGDAG